MTLAAVVRAFAGQDWYPTEMAFTSIFRSALAAGNSFPIHDSFSDRRPVGLHCRGALSLAPLMHGACNPVSDLPLSECQPDHAVDFAASLKSILRPYLPDGYPKVELAAEIAGLSVRTLQRRLAQQGLSYSALVKHLRYEAASQLLKNSDIRMIDAANELGWGSQSTFTRAFSDIAGISPSEYRVRTKRIIPYGQNTHAASRW